MDAIILRRGGMKKYIWNRYNRNSTTTYVWNRYNVVTTTTYNWNRYNVNTTTTYTWRKYSINRTYTVQTGSSISEVTPYRNSYVWRSVATKGPLPTDLYGTGTKTLVSRDNQSSFSGWYSESSDNNSYYNGVVKLGKFDRENAYHAIYTNNYKMVAKSNETHSYIGTVSSTDASAYPNGGSSGSYYYDSRTQSTQQTQGSANGTVSSTNSSAYPSNGVSGNYWYVSNGSTTTYSKGTANGTVSSTNKSQYPDDGRSGSYWYVYSTSNISYSQGSYIDQVESSSRNAYPDNSYVDSYWYVYQGETGGSGGIRRILAG